VFGLQNDFKKSKKTKKKKKTNKQKQTKQDKRKNPATLFMGIAVRLRLDQDNNCELIAVNSARL